MVISTAHPYGIKKPSPPSTSKISQLQQRLFPPEELRWLTVRDAISDLPDPMSEKTAIMRQLANAVPVTLAQQIAQNLRLTLKSADSKVYFDTKHHNLSITVDLLASSTLILQF